MNTQQPAVGCSLCFWATSINSIIFAGCKVFCQGGYVLSLVMGHSPHWPRYTRISPHVPGIFVKYWSDSIKMIFIIAEVISPNKEEVCISYLHPACLLPWWCNIQKTQDKSQTIVSTWTWLTCKLNLDLFCVIFLHLCPWQWGKKSHVYLFRNVTN